MVGHGGSSAGSYLADPTSPIPSHCASIVATSTLRVNCCKFPLLFCLALLDSKGYAHGDLMVLLVANEQDNIDMS